MGGKTNRSEIIKSIGRLIGRVANTIDEEEPDEDDVIGAEKSSCRSGLFIR